MGIRGRIMAEYLDRVCSDVLEDEKLAKFGKEVPRLLVEQVLRLPYIQCDQIGQFIGLWATF